MRKLGHDWREYHTLIREALEKLPPTRRPFGVSAVKAVHEAFYDADLPSTLTLIELWWEALEQRYQRLMAQPWLKEVNIVNPTLEWALDIEDGIMELYASVVHEGGASSIPWGWIYVRRRNQQVFRICMSTLAYIRDTLQFLQTLAETSESDLQEVFRGDPTVIIVGDNLKVAYQEGGSAIYYLEDEER